jgi:hypothetical protein
MSTGTPRCSVRCSRDVYLNLIKALEARAVYQLVRTRVGIVAVAAPYNAKLRSLIKVIAPGI